MQARVQESTGVSVTVEEADLFALTGADREAALSGLTSGLELPFVIVEGVLACSGDFDLERIEQAVGARGAGSDTAPLG